ncbi:MAG: LapA family protein [Phycisphaerales bacterium]|nr:LapA family protein [Phycisphaerales bacterium]
MSETTEQVKTKKSLYKRPKFIASMIAIVIFLILIFQNWASVSVNLFFMTEKQVPASIMYIAFSLIGFIVGWLVRRPKKTDSK